MKKLKYYIPYFGLKLAERDKVADLALTLFHALCIGAIIMTIFSILIRSQIKF